MGLVKRSECVETPARALAVRRSVQSAWVRLQRDLALWADIRAFPPLAVWCGLNCVAALLVLGRARALSIARLSAAQLDLLALATALSAVVARALLARVEAEKPTVCARLIAGAACGLPTLALWQTIPVRQGLAGTMWLFALTACGAAAGALWSRRTTDDLLTAAMSPAARRRLPNTECKLPEGAVAAHPGLVAVPTARDSDEQTTLWIERRTLPAGDEMIQGAARATFSAHQALAVVHVSFSPPLKLIPELTFETRAPEGLRVKAAAVHPWGCRFELKRTEAATAPRQVEIRFRAVACRQLKAAA